MRKEGTLNDEKLPQAILNYKVERKNHKVIEFKKRNRCVLDTEVKQR